MPVGGIDPEDYSMGTRTLKIPYHSSWNRFGQNPLGRKSRGKERSDARCSGAVIPAALGRRVKGTARSL